MPISAYFLQFSNLILSGSVCWRGLGRVLGGSLLKLEICNATGEDLSPPSLPVVLSFHTSIGRNLLLNISCKRGYPMVFPASIFSDTKLSIPFTLRQIGIMTPHDCATLLPSDVYRVLVCLTPLDHKSDTCIGWGSLPLMLN